MKKVLIVDDSISVSRQLQKILADSGDFEVIGHARNGLEAIKMYQAERPDIICMDMNMPEMDGLTTLRTLKTMNKGIQVIMVTSLGGVGDKYIEAIKLGARDVISKPFESDEVIEKLTRL